MYTMKENIKRAKQASHDIEKWLNNFDSITNIRNVENIKEFQKKDIDLLFKTQTGKITSVEIKGDTYHKTGNFFFETKSNVGKDTPGCFMYTEADYLFYYFIVPKTLYILPMPETREWFVNNKLKFRKSYTKTAVKGRHYKTEGRLVQIKTVLREVDNVRKYNLKKYLKE